MHCQQGDTVPHRIIFPEKGVVELQSFVLPDLEPGEVRVKTEYSLMSVGTETIILHQRYAPDTHFANMFSFPQLKTGVQAIGSIEECGKDVKDFQPGNIVYMRAAHGSHQQLDAKLVSPVPDYADHKEACWCGLAKTAFRAAWAAQTSVEDDVLVIGAGPVGQMLTRWIADAAPQTLVVADFSSIRLEFASRGGATSTLQGEITANLDAIKTVNGGAGPSITIDTTGNAAAFQPALAATAKFGKVILLGDCGYPDRQRLTSDMMSKGLTLQATHDSHDRDGWDQRRVDALFFERVQDGRYPLSGLITHEFAPERCAEAYLLAESHRHETMGILYDWTAKEY